MLISWSGRVKHETPELTKERHIHIHWVCLGLAEREKGSVEYLYRCKCVCVRRFCLDSAPVLPQCAWNIER